MKFIFQLTILTSLASGCSMSAKQSTENSPSQNEKTKMQDAVESSLKKINGANLEMPPQKIAPSEMMGLKEMNVEWVAVIPYAFSRPGETFVRFGGANQWWGESTEGTIECITMAHAGNMKVMLKPHILSRPEIRLQVKN